MSDIILDQFGNPLGWDPDKEDLHTAALAEFSVPALVCDAPVSIPDTLEIPGYRQDMQGAWPFCHAHMRTMCSEILTWMATKGELRHYSRKFAAITDMRQDGNDRRPAGASIGGSMRAALNYGECLETDFPYYVQGENYSNVIPAELLTRAAKTHIRTLVPGIRSFEDFDRAMVTGNVTCGFGIDWTTGWSGLRGVEYLTYMPGGNFLGGHALGFFGWRTRGGERHYAMYNSHPGWGADTRIFVAPAVIDKICRTTRYGLLLASDMNLAEPVKPRGWDWIDSANFIPPVFKL